MRYLTSAEIEKCAKGANVKHMAVENFLGTMGTDAQEAYANLAADAKSYRWNVATANAIRKGIKLACEPRDDHDSVESAHDEHMMNEHRQYGLGYMQGRRGF